MVVLAMTLLGGNAMSDSMREEIARLLRARGHQTAVTYAVQHGCADELQAEQMVTQVEATLQKQD